MINLVHMSYTKKLPYKVIQHFWFAVNYSTTEAQSWFKLLIFVFFYWTLLLAFQASKNFFCPTGSLSYLLPLASTTGARLAVEICPGKELSLHLLWNLTYWWIYHCWILLASQHGKTTPLISLQHLQWQNNHLAAVTWGQFHPDHSYNAEELQISPQSMQHDAPFLQIMPKLPSLTWSFLAGMQVFGPPNWAKLPNMTKRRS